MNMVENVKRNLVETSLWQIVPKTTRNWSLTVELKVEFFVLKGLIEYEILTNQGKLNTDSMEISFTRLGILRVREFRQSGIGTSNQILSWIIQGIKQHERKKWQEVYCYVIVQLSNRWWMNGVEIYREKSITIKYSGSFDLKIVQANSKE